MSKQFRVSKKVHPLCVLFFGYILSKLIATIKIAGFLFHTEFAMVFFEILSLMMLIALCLSFIFWYNRSYSLSEFFITSKNERRITVVSLFLAFVSSVIICNVANFNTIISGHHIYLLKIRDLSTLSSMQLLSHTISVIVCSPIIEEILFRGILQKYLTGIMKNKYHLISIAIVSIVFSISHCEFTKIPYYFLCGFLYSFIYYKTQKIIIPIIVHIFWNLLSTILTLDLKPINGGSNLVFLTFIIALWILAKSLYRYDIKDLQNDF